MSKTEVKKKFIDRMEFFYRNFGSEWTSNDFVSNDNQKEYLGKLLIELQNKGVISINKEGKSFTILYLPSKYDNLLI